MKMLLDLPDELLISIIEQLSGERKALCQLARVCKRLQPLAEAPLYETIFYREGYQAQGLVNAVTAESRRGAALRYLECRMFWLGAPEVQGVLSDILFSAPRVREVVIESPYCNHSRWRKVQAGQRWNETMRKILEPFIQATGLAEGTLERESASLGKPLQNLTSLVMHLNGANREFWTVSPLYGSLFALPALESLHISSANLLADSTSLIPGTFKSPLKHLFLDECNMTLDALRNILAIPKALQSLHLGENHWSPEEEAFPTPHQPYNELCKRDPEAFMDALALQKGTLSSFTYDAKVNIPDFSSSTVRPQTAGAGFSEFNSLEDVNIVSPSVFLTGLFTSSYTAPSKLKKLSLGGVELHQQLFDVQEAASAHLGPDAAVPALIRRAASSMPLLGEIIITFDRIAGVLAEALHGPIETTGKYLKDRNVKLRLLQQPAVTFTVRPVLYGEHMIADQLIYANDGTGFKQWREPFEEEERPRVVMTTAHLAQWGNQVIQLAGAAAREEDEEWEDLESEDETDTETEESEDEHGDATDDA